MTALIEASPRLAPIAHPIADAFLLGFVSACSLVAALFFLKFWRSTRDTLFLAFCLFFAIQGVTSCALLGADHPNEGKLWNAVIRLLALLGLLGAIVWKNIYER
jgi:uncharacterized membrane protein HdeD (DUF308 family)